MSTFTIEFTHNCTTVVYCIGILVCWRSLSTVLKITSPTNGVNTKQIWNIRKIRRRKKSHQMQLNGLQENPLHRTEDAKIGSDTDFPSKRYNLRHRRVSIRHRRHLDRPHKIRMRNLRNICRRQLLGLPRALSIRMTCAPTRCSP